MSTKIMKHVGTYGGKPCVIVFRELPEDNDSALIVPSNTLEGQLHDDVMNVVDSHEAQSAQDISEVLHRRMLSDGENMLSALHARGKLQKVPVSMVQLTPAPNQSVPLGDINKEIKKIVEGTNPPLKTDSPETRVTTAQIEGTTANTSSEPSDIAKNLLTQASLLEQDAKSLVEDAERKRNEAYEMDPGLRPKKGPGRPQKATIDNI
jgi:hypothetical protein